MKDDRFDRLANELLRLIEIPSPSGNEGPIIEYLENRLRFLKVPTKIQPIVGKTGNLVLNPGSKTLLDLHVDTVPGVMEGVRCSARLEGDLVYGRGAADVKGSIASLIIALEDYVDEVGNNHDFPASIVFTVDEEQGGSGAYEAVKLCPEEVIVFEPTELDICTMEAGAIGARLNFFGQTAHGSDFEAGQNAISKAVDFLSKLKKLPFLEGEHPYIGEAGFNVQSLSGGSPNELIIPSRCEMYIDIRLLPDVDHKEAERQLRHLFDREGIEYEMDDISPPFNLGEDVPIADKLMGVASNDLGLNLQFGAFKSWSDAEPYVTAGIPAVVFGPGKLSVAHTPFEHVSLKEMDLASQILTAFLTNLLTFSEHELDYLEAR